MKRRRAVREKWLALCTALLLGLMPAFPLAAESAPLTQRSAAASGTVRVYLSSLSSLSSLDLTIAGSYSVNGDTTQAFTRGDQVTVSCSGSSLTLSKGGVARSMGSSFKLRRHQTSGENGVRIAQARNSANLYGGDIEFRANGGKVQAIVHVYIEDYMNGVLPYEMSNGFPLEALKAQAVAARTYVAAKMAQNRSTYDVVDTTSDQVYRGTPSGNATCKQAVEETAGIVAMYNGAYIGAYYTASNGGQTESIKNAWGTSGYPYLSVKDDPYDLKNSMSPTRSVTVYKTPSQGTSNQTLERLVKQKVASATGLSTDGVTITEYVNVRAYDPKFADPSRLYRKVEFTVRVQGLSSPVTVSLDYFSEMESALSLSLNTTQNELVSVSETDSTFRITARRYGHGIGMSQRGAQQMASEGMRYEDIIGFYYPGVSRVKINFTRAGLLQALDGSSWPEEAPGPDSGNDGPDNGEETIATAVVSLSSAYDVLNLRAQKNTDSGVIARIPHGTQLAVLEDDGTWCRVRYGVQTGYVVRSYLTFVSAQETPVPGETTPRPTQTPGGQTSGYKAYVVLSGGYLNLRAEPYTSSAVLARVYSGEMLDVLDTSYSGWVRVSREGVVGYVSRQYVQIIEISGGGSSAEPTPTPVPEATATPEPTGTPDPDATATPEPTPTPAPQKELRAVVELSSSSQTLNLRETPSLDSRVLARLPHGMVLEVEERYQTWSRVNATGLVGYVLNSYVRFEEYVPAPQTTPTPEAPLNPEATPDPEATPAPEQTPQPTNTPVTTELVARIALSGPGSKLNLRASAGTWADVLTRIPHGAYVHVESYDPAWSQVRYEGWTGYVSSQYLVLEERPVQTPEQTDSPESTPAPTQSPEEWMPSEVVVSVSSSLNMRSTPSTRGKIVARLYDGERLTVVGQGTGWYQVRYGSVEGWVSADYVVPIYANAPPEPTKAPAPTPEPEPTASPERTEEPGQTTEPTAEPERTPEPERTAEPEETPAPEKTREPQPTARPGDVINTGEARQGAALREKTRDDAPVLLSMEQGDDVRVVEYTSSQWARAESQGVYGYVRLTDLYLDYWAAVCDLNGLESPLYEEKSEESAAVGTLSDAEVVTVYRVEDGWARVRTGGGREGYCLEGLLNIL